MNTQVQHVRPLALVIVFATCFVVPPIGLADIRSFDSTITRDVQEKVKRDFLLREADATVKTIAGNVWIEGQVSNNRLMISPIGERTNDAYRTTA